MDSIPPGLWSASCKISTLHSLSSRLVIPELKYWARSLFVMPSQRTLVSLKLPRLPSRATLSGIFKGIGHSKPRGCSKSRMYVRKLNKKDDRLFSLEIITVCIPLWGMIGLWTTKIGFHNTWEFWLYNVSEKVDLRIKGGKLKFRTDRWCSAWVKWVFSAPSWASAE